MALMLSSGCAAMRATQEPADDTTSVSWPAFGPRHAADSAKAAAMTSAKAQRIHGRTTVRLAKQQTKQKKQETRTQKDQNRTQKEVNRTQSTAAVQLAKQETQRAEAWARADLERARAERKAAEAEKLKATAANVRLGMQIGAAVLVVVALLWVVRKARGLAKIAPLLGLLLLTDLAAADGGRTRKRWRKSPNGRLHAVAPKIRRNIW